MCKMQKLNCFRWKERVSSGNLLCSICFKQNWSVGLNIWHLRGKSHLKSEAHGTLGYIGVCQQIDPALAFSTSLSSSKRTYPSCCLRCMNVAGQLQHHYFLSPSCVDASTQTLHSSGPEGNSCCLHFHSWAAQHSGRLKYGTVVLLFNNIQAACSLVILQKPKDPGVPQ